MGILDFFYKNPTRAASSTLDQIPGTLKPYYDPFINAGTGALNTLQGQYGQMMSDPNSIISMIAGGYKQSPGYNWRLGQGQQAITNASAAGGMAGTPMQQQQAGQLAENMASDDFDKYMQRALGIYGGGISGEEGLMKQGFGASTDLATSLANMLMSKSGLEYRGAQGRNDMISQLLGILGGVGSAALLGK